MNAWQRLRGYGWVNVPALRFASAMSRLDSIAAEDDYLEEATA